MVYPITLKIFLRVNFSKGGYVGVWTIHEDSWSSEFYRAELSGDLSDIFNRQSPK